MLNIDLTGRRALVAGVADDGGFGFAIAKALAEAGASVCVGTWPPALNIFLNLLERGKMDESRRLSRRLAARRSSSIYPLDAAFDTLRRDARRSSARASATRTSATSRSTGSRSASWRTSASSPLDIVVHSLANGPEVKKPLLETVAQRLPRRGERERLLARVAWSQRLGPLMRDGRRRSRRSRTWRASA